MSQKNEFTLEFTLRQHTPLIHFQADQPGATLRATELKPKLDRFLRRKDPTLPFREHHNDRYSLDYKVSITPDTSAAEAIPERHKLFFGNMGHEPEDHKHFKKHEKTFKVTFFSYHAKILDAIEREFASFMAQTNFGTRQSKGFGSFFPENTSFSPELVDTACIYAFSSTLKKYENDIALLYSFFRSGLNYPDRNGNTRFYIKSAMFAYAKSKNITWDKKAIKQHYFNDQLQRQSGEHPDSEALHFEGNGAYLMRDLLGLSTAQEWRSYNATITKSHPDIGRFRSPIFFKPIQEDPKKEHMTVYLWAQSPVEPILSKIFTIQRNNNGDLQLATPDTFDIDDFLSFACAIDLDEFVEEDYHREKEFQDLNRILSEIRQNGRTA